MTVTMVGEGGREGGREEASEWKVQLPRRLVTGNIIPHPLPTPPTPPPRMAVDGGNTYGSSVGGGGERRSRWTDGQTDARYEDGELADGDGVKSKQASGRARAGRRASQRVFGGRSEWLHHQHHHN